MMLILLAATVLAALIACTAAVTAEPRLGQPAGTNF